jgi:hypothetical protein
MNPAKIRLSPKEMELVTNADWILTKNAIMEKVRALLAGQLLMQQSSISSIKLSLTEVVLEKAAKISRGENYKGLPYVILDHPRYFSTTDTLAIRTMFWWGHFFSTTLQLAGKFREQYTTSLCRHYIELKNADAYISSSNEQWQHHFEEDNYLRIASIEETEFNKMLLENNFCKIAMKTELSDWTLVEDALSRQYSLCMRILRGIKDKE